LEFAKQVGGYVARQQTKQAFVHGMKEELIALHSLQFPHASSPTGKEVSDYHDSKRVYRSQAQILTEPNRDGLCLTLRTRFKPFLDIWLVIPKQDFQAV
jgi:hypothetical protein